MASHSVFSNQALVKLLPPAFSYLMPDGKDVIRMQLNDLSQCTVARDLKPPEKLNSR